MEIYDENNFDVFHSITKQLSPSEIHKLFVKVVYYMFKSDPRLDFSDGQIWFWEDMPKKYRSKLESKSEFDLFIKLNNTCYIVDCHCKQSRLTRVEWRDIILLRKFLNLNHTFKGLVVTNSYNIGSKLQLNKHLEIQTIYGSFMDTLSFDLHSLLVTGTIQKYLPIVSRYERNFVPILNSILYFSHFDNSKGILELAGTSDIGAISYHIHKGLAFQNQLTVILTSSTSRVIDFYLNWMSLSNLTDHSYTFYLPQIKSEGVRGSEAGLSLPFDNFILKTRLKTNRVVIITTYQDVSQILSIHRSQPISLMIFDDAYKTNSMFVSSEIKALLKDKHLQIEKRLFITNVSKSSIGDHATDTMVYMDHKTIYGNRIYCYNLRDAISDGKLSSYKIVASYIQNSDIIKIVSTMLPILKETNTNIEFIGISILLIIKLQKSTCNRIVTYHQSDTNAIVFTEILKCVSTISNSNLEHLPIINITSNTIRSSIVNIVEEFSTKSKAIICTTYDNSDLMTKFKPDSVCFVDESSDKPEYIKCVSTLLSNNQIITIIVPLIVKSVTDSLDNKLWKCSYRFNMPANAMGNAHRRLINIIKAFSIVDPLLMNLFGDSSAHTLSNNKLLSSSSSRLVSKEIFFEGESSLDIKQWNRAIDANISETLRYFIDKCLRIEQKHDYYTSSTKQLLTHHTSAKSNYCRLVEFVDEQDRLPKPSISEERDLANWCYICRLRYRKGTISNNLINLLEKISIWSWKSLNSFDSNISKLIEFVNKQKHLPRPYSSDLIEQKLFRWCSLYKSQYNRQILSDIKIKKFEKVNGWTWERSSQMTDFTIQCQMLQTWVQKYKQLPHKNIKSDQNPIQRKLSIWCTQMQNRYSSNHLTLDQIRQLEAIPGWSWVTKPIQNKFLAQFGRLAEWIKNNHCIPSAASTDLVEQGLGQWCGRIRFRKRRQLLKKDQIVLFKKLPYWYWDRNQKYKSGSKTSHKIKKIEKINH